MTSTTPTHMTPDGHPVRVLRTWTEPGYFTKAKVEFAEVVYLDGHLPYPVAGRLGGSEEAPTWEHRVKRGKVMVQGDPTGQAFTWEDGLQPLTCSCQWADDEGNLEVGPDPYIAQPDEACPQHGRQADPEGWAESDRWDEAEEAMLADTAKRTGQTLEQVKASYAAQYDQPEEEQAGPTLAKAVEAWVQEGEQRDAFSSKLAQVVSTPKPKAQQARELTGPQTGQELEPLRSGLLIAKHQGQRYYWPKSQWATLEAAEEAIQAAGIHGHGLAFTQYRASGPFHNLGEWIARHTPSQSAGSTHSPEEGTMTESTTTTPTAEQVAQPTPDQEAKARKRQAAKASPAKGQKASQAKAKGSSKAKGTAKAAPKGSWASRNPELVATIPAEIAKGTHPRQFAEANGVSLEIAWAAFKRAGWVATGKGGGKPFEFKSAADRRNAQKALDTLKALGSPSTVIRALEREQAQAKA